MGFDRAADLFAGTVIRDLRHGHCRERLGRQLDHALDLLDLLADRHRCGGASVRDPLAQGIDLLLDGRRIRRQSRQEALQPLARVGDLVLRHPDRHGLRTEDVVDCQLVLLLLEPFQVRARHQHQHVAGDHLLGIEALDADRLGRRQRLAICGSVSRPPSLAQVWQPVVPAIVAEDRGVDRVSFQDSVPEAVGQLVDGDVRVGHGFSLSSVRAGRGGV